MRTESRVFAAVHGTLDEVLARGGFVPNQDSVNRDDIRVLLEALPTDAYEQVPRFAALVGEREEPCFDIWVVCDVAGTRVEDVHVEAWKLPALLREAELHDHAAAYEAAEGLEAQLAACAAAFEALFALSGE